MNRADSSMRHGTVHTVHDAVVDIRFAPEWLPIPTSLLISTGGKDAAPAHLRVVAQLDHETVRALRSPAPAPVTIGSKVTTLANAGLRGIVFEPIAWKTARFRAVQAGLYGSTATIYKL